MNEESARAYSPKESNLELPIVSEDTVKAIVSQFTTGGEVRGWGEHLEQVKAELIKENPHLVSFMEILVGRYPQQLHTPMFEVIVGTIAVLQHQASANKTASIFGKPTLPAEPNK